MTKQDAKSHLLFSLPSAVFARNVATWLAPLLAELGMGNPGWTSRVEALVFNGTPW
jgi:hypothetical protein